MQRDDYLGCPCSLGLSRISCGRCLKQDLQDYWGFSGLQASGCCLFGGSFLRGLRGQIAEGRLFGMPLQPGSVPDFLWTLSEAGFTGLLGIFRIAGERLLPVWRILFKSGERADCRGTINWDARRSLGLSRISCSRCLKQDLQEYWGFSGLQAIG